MMNAAAAIASRLNPTQKETSIVRADNQILCDI
jgi:hypothetical protein